MTLRRLSKGLFLACLLPGVVLQGADGPAPAIRRTLVGLRVEYLPTSLFRTQGVQFSTAKPVADYSYVASSGSSKMTIAPEVEYRLSDHFSLAAEFDFRRAQYKQVEEMLSGRRDPNISWDDRRPSTITETTKAVYLELPVLARYYLLGQNRWLRKTYLSGGLQFRHIGGIHTETESSYADGVTDDQVAPAQPNRANQLGLVIAAGFRHIDESGIRLAPEVRFIRWQGMAFQGTAYRSVRHQLEVGLGISF